MGLQTNGLSLEVVGREVSGRPVPGKPRRPAGPYLLGLPALLLSCLLLIPIGVTVVAAFRTPGGLGFGNFAVMGDPGALRAVGNSLLWVLVAFGLVAVGFFLALLSYRLPALTSFLQEIPPQTSITPRMQRQVLGHVITLGVEHDDHLESEEDLVGLSCRGVVAEVVPRLVHRQPEGATLLRDVQVVQLALHDGHRVGGPDHSPG